LYADVPLSLSALADGHVHAIILDAPHAVQLPQHELDELGLAVLGDNRQAVDDDERVETLIEAHLELFFDIGKVDLGLVELVFLQREVLV
jgi:hypothetical protein